MEWDTLDARPAMGTSGVTFLQARVRSGARRVARIAHEFPFATCKARLREARYGDERGPGEECGERKLAWFLRREGRAEEELALGITGAAITDTCRVEQAVPSGGGGKRVRRLADMQGMRGVQVMGRCGREEGKAVGGSTGRRRRPIQGRATGRPSAPNSFRGKFLFSVLASAFSHFYVIPRCTLLFSISH